MLVMIFRFILLFLLAAMLGLTPPILTGDGAPGAAWADDDDDGDDDGDDDDGDDRDDDDDDVDRGGSRFGGRDEGYGGNVPRLRQSGDDNFLGRLFSGPQRSEPTRRAVPSQAPRQAPAPAPPATPQPLSAPDEVVALALNTEDLSALTAQGFEVIEELLVPGLAATPRRLRIPEGTTLAAARASVRALPTGQNADFNHYYRSEAFDEDCEALECPARRMIDWPELSDRVSGCGGGVPIGMIDTGINDAHETFEGADLEVLRLSPEAFTPSRALHGTAVAALLVGDPGTRSPGLVPSARLVAVDAFYRRGSDERADVFTLIAALGQLSERGVGVINLSLAGPPNTVLEEVVGRLVGEQDIVLVAAVGNDGPRADPAFPAAYAEVIAVTAVDRDRVVYRRAIRGAHVDLAAPGVAVWTAASISGARWKTGTSYAVPFVSAAAAILREERPELTAPEVGAELLRLAIDLGDPGRDPVFGAGLLDLGSLCEGRPSPTPVAQESGTALP